MGRPMPSILTSSDAFISVQTTLPVETMDQIQIYRNSPYTKLRITIASRKSHLKRLTQAAVGKGRSRGRVAIAKQRLQNQILIMERQLPKLRHKWFDNIEKIIKKN